MRSLVFWKAMAEGWGGDLWKERNGLLGEKKNPPKACEAEFHGDRSVLAGEKDNPQKAREADFGRWRSGLPLGKEKPPKAREADFGRWRSVLAGEKERGDLGKASFWCGKCSALHVLAQHAASANAARCISHRTALRFPPPPSPSCPKAPSSSPSSASLLPCLRAGHHREGL